MKKGLLLVFALLITITSFSQNVVEYNGEKINALDENNNQTGTWKLFDEENKVLITCEFKNGEYISNTNFYKDSKLIASYNHDINKLEIYKDSKTTVCSFYTDKDNITYLIGENGKPIDKEIQKYYVFGAGEVMSKFYGGNEKLYEFIGNNFNSNGNKGKVVVKFRIDQKGFASQAEILSSTNDKLNDEAIRVISIIPRCQPAYQRCRFVNSSYSIPINIK
ncbi:hypothetical protein G4D82_13935 [Flavobacterium sp. CYK-4]|uniref:energy transducer TonB n=1 Tax=Flavobacterium lotistagni TaxID=2709660 RepID=UPI00140900CE|nr:energy transducer TonB [Flavobacterium lotistagni]NHM08324.1 hypothetical protein [Flavobacterium lotistagni]